MIGLKIWSFDAFFQGNIEEILDDDILMINRKKMINNKNVVNKILANSWTIFKKKLHTQTMNHRFNYSTYLVQNKKFACSNYIHTYSRIRCNFCVLISWHNCFFFRWKCILFAYFKSALTYTFKISLLFLSVSLNKPWVIIFIISTQAKK